MRATSPPVLQQRPGGQPPAQTQAFGLPGFVLLQYASTIGGLLAVAGWAIHRLRGAAAHADAALLSPRMRAVVLAALAAAGVAGMVLWPLWLHPTRHPESVVFWAGMGAVMSTACALLAYCLAFTVLRALRAGRGMA